MLFLDTMNLPTGPWMPYPSHNSCGWIHLDQKSLSHPDPQSLITKIQSRKALGSWDFKNGLIWYRQKVFIPAKSNLISTITAFVHNSCHEGYQKTLFRIFWDFHWSGMRTQIREFVATYLPFLPTQQRGSLEVGWPAPTAPNSSTCMDQHLNGFRRRSPDFAWQKHDIGSDGQILQIRPLCGALTPLHSTADCALILRAYVKTTWSP